MKIIAILLFAGITLLSFPGNQNDNPAGSSVSLVGSKADTVTNASPNANGNSNPDDKIKDPFKDSRGIFVIIGGVIVENKTAVDCSVAGSDYVV